MSNKNIKPSGKKKSRKKNPFDSDMLLIELFEVNADELFGMDDYEDIARLRRKFDK